MTAAPIDRDARRTLIEGSPDLDGIDFVEVLPGQRTLLVHLLNRAVPAGLRVRVEGGVRADPRLNPVRVLWAHTALAVAGGGGVAPTGGLAGVGGADRALVDAALPDDADVRSRVLAVRTSSTGDWSTYVLHLTDDSGVPDGFDEPLTSCPFSFTVDCVADTDCATSQRPAVEPVSKVVGDYLARDYEALRARLLERLSTLQPQWTDRSAADPGVALVELFAYLGDRLAYWQDAVGREAYLGTAARRTSVRRHARLLDYPMHEGCAALTWLAVTTDVPTTIRAGAAVAQEISVDLPLQAHEAGAAVFETRHDVAVSPARNGIDLHPWGDPDHELPAGSRGAFLAATVDPHLSAGDVLLLVDCPAPRPIATAPGDPTHLRSGDPAVRYAVRLDREPVVHSDPLAPGVTVLEVHWSAADALPGPLRVSSPAPDGSPQPRAVALANVIAADHGATVLDEALVPSQATADRYRPRLARPGLAWSQPHDQLAATTPAHAPTDPRLAVPAVTVHDGTRMWTAVPDLVGSGRLDAHFVVETDEGITRLRFGDGRAGRRPTFGSQLRARYRLGGGSGGNVAAGRLTHWLQRADASPVEDGGASLTVWNPLPALGGTDPEPVAAVQRFAPTAYRHQLRAVTDEDHADAAASVPGVTHAVARRVWTGSWYAVQAMVDPQAAVAGDPGIPAAVVGLLERRRMAGTDVEVVRPVYVPLGIALSVCLQPGYPRAQVRRQLLDALSSWDLPDGRLGFFHPDRFTFGQPVLLSDLVAAAMAVPGIATLSVTGFARLASPAADTTANLRAGRLEVGAFEVPRCDSDPNNPEMGRVEVTAGGGS